MIKEIKTQFTNFIYKEDSSSIFYYLSPVLSILSSLFAIVLKTRLLAYKYSLFKTDKLKIKIISIGNITLGGTGKTPAVEMVCKYLLDEGVKVAVLSRGYKAKSNEPVNIVSDGKNILLDQKSASDEPYMLANKLKGVPILTGSKRFLTGTYAKENLNIETLVLDDGFQHIQLSRDLNILLIDSEVIFGNDHLFPRGILREPACQINRADVILFTKCNKKFNPNTVLDGLLKKDIPIFKSSVIPTGCIDIHSEKQEPVNFLKGKKVFAFCGIGTPKSFKNTLEETGAAICGFQEFPDHHSFTKDEIKEIEQQGIKSNAEVFITTEKDSMRLINTPQLSLPLLMLKIEMKLHDKRDEWNHILTKFNNP